MNDMVPRAQSLRGEALGKESRFSPISDGRGGSVQGFDGIDWSAAAPSWTSMIGGIFLPTLAAVSLIAFLDIAFCGLFQRWIGHPWGSAQWMLATIMLPCALASAFVCVKVMQKSYRRS